MALELDDGDMMVIHFLLFCKSKMFFKTFFCIAIIDDQVFDRTFPWKFL